MAKRPDVQYIQFYIDGSAARKLEPVASAVEKKVAPRKVSRRPKRRTIYIDPVATIGIAVAVCMLTMMLLGLTQLKAAKQEAAVMDRYVSELRLNNHTLSKEYKEGYDLADIEEKALALGMVPAAQAPQTTILISGPAQEEPVSIWEQVGTFLTSLFA